MRWSTFVVRALLAWSSEGANISIFTVVALHTVITCCSLSSLCTRCSLTPLRAHFSRRTLGRQPNGTRWARHAVTALETLIPVVARLASTTNGASASTHSPDSHCALGSRHTHRTLITTIARGTLVALRAFNPYRTFRANGTCVNTSRMSTLIL